MNSELEVYKSDLDKGDYIKKIMIERATGQYPDEKHYKELRHYFITRRKNITPDIVRKNRDFNQFWIFIKNKYRSYEERRIFIHNEFNDFLEELEKDTVIPCYENINSGMKKMNSDLILNEWNKATDRKNDDPDGAITMARTLIESTLKHILEDSNRVYGNKDDLPQLYKQVSKELNLYPQKYEDESFKKILGSCANIVSELGNLRNGIGDAHGKGRKVYKPSTRHAEFAVNLAGTMSLFLIQTYEHNKR